MGYAASEVRGAVAAAAHRHLWGRRKGAVAKLSRIRRRVCANYSQAE